VKSYSEFTDWINTNGLPDMIAFDHDLADVKVIEGSELVLATDFEKMKSGFDCAKWLVEYCINNNVELPQWTVQSANPVGRDNINGLLNNYRKHCS